MAIDWNAIYADELAKIADPTETINNEMNTALGSLTTNKDAAAKALNDQQTFDIDALTNVKTANESKLQEQLDAALRQSYITREMNKKDLPALMANLGLTGGYTETAANDLLRNYRNTNNAANKNYNTSLTNLGTQYGSDVAGLKSQYGGRIGDITNTYNSNYANAQSDYQRQLREALEARKTNTFNNANTRYQNELAREQWEWQQQQAASPTIVATGNGGGGGGGGNEPGVNKDLNYSKVNTKGTFAGSGDMSDQYKYSKGSTKRGWIESGANWGQR